MATPKKPRIRKSAPTVRERQEEARIVSEKPDRPSRIKPVAGKVASPLKKLPRRSLPDNKITRPIKKVLSFLVPRYFINSYREVRQVTWPSRGDTWRLTGAVFIFAAVFGAMVAGVDKVLDIIFKNLVLK